MSEFKQLSRSVKGLTVLVTGAASGMGRATARVFASEGANVAVTDYDEQGAHAVAKEIAASGGSAKAWKLDVADRNDFIWVSGVWREAPPERHWIPGTWQKVEDGWQWISGLWASDQTEQLEYVPSVQIETVSPQLDRSLNFPQADFRDFEHFSGKPWP